MPKYGNKSNYDQAFLDALDKNTSKFNWQEREDSDPTYNCTIEIPKGDDVQELSFANVKYNLINNDWESIRDQNILRNIFKAVYESPDDNELAAAFGKFLTETDKLYSKEKNIRDRNRLYRGILTPLKNNDHPFAKRAVKMIEDELEATKEQEASAEDFREAERIEAEKIRKEEEDRRKAEEEQKRIEDEKIRIEIETRNKLREQQEKERKEREEQAQKQKEDQAKIDNENDKKAGLIEIIEPLKYYRFVDTHDYIKENEVHLESLQQKNILRALMNFRQSTEDEVTKNILDHAMIVYEGVDFKSHINDNDLLGELLISNNPHAVQALSLIEKELGMDKPCSNEAYQYYVNKITTIPQQISAIEKNAPIAKAYNEKVNPEEEKLAQIFAEWESLKAGFDKRNKYEFTEWDKHLSRSVDQYKNNALTVSHHNSISELKKIAKFYVENNQDSVKDLKEDDINAKVFKLMQKSIDASNVILAEIDKIEKNHPDLLEENLNQYYKDSEKNLSKLKKSLKVNQMRIVRENQKRGIDDGAIYLPEEKQPEITKEEFEKRQQHLWDTKLKPILDTRPANMEYKDFAEYLNGVKNNYNEQLTALNDSWKTGSQSGLFTDIKKYVKNITEFGPDTSFNELTDKINSINSKISEYIKVTKRKPDHPNDPGVIKTQNFYKATLPSVKALQKFNNEFLNKLNNEHFYFQKLEAEENFRNSIKNQWTEEERMWAEQAETPEGLIGLEKRFLNERNASGTTFVKSYIMSLTDEQQANLYKAVCEKKYKEHIARHPLIKKAQEIAKESDYLKEFDADELAVPIFKKLASEDSFEAADGILKAFPDYFPKGKADEIDATVRATLEEEDLAKIEMIDSLLKSDTLLGDGITKDVMGNYKIKPKNAYDVLSHDLDALSVLQLFAGRARGDIGIYSKDYEGELPADFVEVNNSLKNIFDLGRDCTPRQAKNAVDDVKTKVNTYLANNENKTDAFSKGTCKYLKRLAEKYELSELQIKCDALCPDKKYTDVIKENFVQLNNMTKDEVRTKVSEAIDKRTLKNRENINITKRLLENLKSCNIDSASNSAEFNAFRDKLREVAKLDPNCSPAEFKDAYRKLGVAADTYIEKINIKGGGHKHLFGKKGAKRYDIATKISKMSSKIARTTLGNYYVNPDKPIKPNAIAADKKSLAEISEKKLNDAVSELTTIASKNENLIIVPELDDKGKTALATVMVHAIIEIENKVGADKNRPFTDAIGTSEANYNKAIDDMKNDQAFMNKMEENGLLNLSPNNMDDLTDPQKRQNLARDILSASKTLNNNEKNKNDKKLNDKKEINNNTEIKVNKK